MGGSWQKLGETALLGQLRKARLMLYFATCAKDGQPMPCRRPLFLAKAVGDERVLRRQHLPDAHQAISPAAANLQRRHAPAPFSQPTKLLDAPCSPFYISEYVNIGIIYKLRPSRPHPAQSAQRPWQRGSGIFRKLAGLCIGALSLYFIGQPLLAAI